MIKIVIFDNLPPQMSMSSSKPIPPNKQSVTPSHKLVKGKHCCGVPGQKYSLDAQPEVRVQLNTEYMVDRHHNNVES